LLPLYQTCRWGVCEINSNLAPEVLTNGIDFEKYYRIDIVIREERISSAIYTASFLEPSKRRSQFFSYITHNLNYMYAGIAKIEFMNEGSISATHRMVINLNTGDPATNNYTILGIMGYKHI